MVYTAYGSVIKFIKILDVSSVERIEIEYEDADMENVKGIYSLTFYNREYIGDEIRWDEEGCDTFKIYNKGTNIDNDSDTEDDEEEHPEDDIIITEYRATKDSRNSVQDDLNYLKFHCSCRKQIKRIFDDDYEGQFVYNIKEDEYDQYKYDD
jgi:hypothetical protein